MKWKDFFYFSRGQRIGILILLVLIVLTFALDIFFLRRLKPPPESNGEAFLREALEFRASLENYDSIMEVTRQQRYKERYAKRNTSYTWPNASHRKAYQLFGFDPNTIDSAGLLRLGLTPRMASSLLKYRSKGGSFRNKEDFGKIYGIPAQKKEELMPYIEIDPSRKQIRKDEGPKEDISIELNAADTTQLMRVRGIGRSYARSIVGYRKRLGGFVSVEQLREIYGMRPENYERIAPQCRVDLSLLQPIKVNTASVSRLRQHPYLNFYQAKAIYELRRERGRLQDIDELSNLEEFTTENLTKIKPYLSFE